MPDKKILLVDDNPKVTAISSYLEKLGFKMFNALDGNEALRIIKLEEPKLVILDMEMPRVNGLQILSMLKTNHKDIKYLFLPHTAKSTKKKPKK